MQKDPTGSIISDSTGLRQGDRFSRSRGER
uniref:Uncharacterized protein n=1 Tax=Anguilla anguilla TaxID=7936 RepID=A0A0E9SJJ6_ANGAN